MVLLAMGFLGPERSVLEELKVKLDPRGNIETPRSKYHTSIPKVYGAGGRCSPFVWMFHSFVKVSLTLNLLYASFVALHLWTLYLLIRLHICTVSPKSYIAC